MIQGVKTKKLKAIFDGRGFLMEMLRSDDPIFKKFGQVYMTYCKYGVAKGWHYHRKQTDNMVCVHGKALVVLCDLRKKSPTYMEVNKFILESPPSKKAILVQIPKMVAHGFTALNKEGARIINTPTKTYNYKKPDELRFPWDAKEIPYQWPKSVKKGG